MLKLYDRDHNFIGRILKYVDCKKESEVATGDATLSFTYLAGTFDIQNEYYVQTKDAEYVVKEVSGSRSKGQDIVAVLNLEDLEQNAFQEFSVTDTTIDAAARLLLAGTGWIVGECTVTKRRNAGMRQVDVRQGILKLCAAFMCEPVFDTKKKTVSFYSEVGEDKGVYFLHGLNLKDLSKTKNSYDYYTRIIPIGADGLTIEGINDGKNYLENYQYSNKVRPYIWVDESYTDAQALKEDAEWKLDDMSKPVVEYSAKVIDLAKQNQAYDILSYHLGDRVMLIDQDTGTREKQRIVKMTEYEQEPEKNTCELANTVLTFEEMQDRLQAAADIVGYTMTSDGKIHVSDILKWEEGVAGSQAVQGLSSSVSTLNGQYGALSLLVGTINANYLSAEQADLKYADIERLNAAEATVHSIQGDYAEFKTTVTDELSAQTAIIEALKASQITTEYLDAHYLNAEQADLKYATMESLNATNAAVGSLSAAQAEFESATAKNFEAQTATINDLKAAMITADYLVANYAQIDLANIKDGCITTAMIGQGVVGTVQIADSSITDAKIVGLTANKITAGTLDAAEITVINLDCANLTVGTINGQQIAPGAISLSNLAEDLSGTITNTAEDVKQALEDAGLAQSTATAAQGAADAASVAASKAQTAAEGASTAASKAQSTAESASTAASKAQSTADSANTAAGKAQSTADAANTAAGKAQGAAESAQSAANTAKSTAEAAKTAATTAQTTADGKNTVFYQIAAPATTGRKTNDVWFDTDDANRMYYFDGKAWAAKQFGGNAIAANSITAAHLVANAVTAGKIAAGAVTSGTIAANAVTAGTIAAGAVSADSLTSNAVTAGKIAANAVTTATIAAGAVNADKIASNAVTADKVNAGAITTDKLGAGAVTAAKMAAKTITANSGVIADAAITSAMIASLDAGKITTGTLAAERIGAKSIDAGKLNVSTLSAIAANLGTVTAGVIQSPDFKMSDYGADVNGNVTGTVLSGCQLNLTENALRTPQITIQRNFINVNGYITIGTRRSESTIGQFGSFTCGNSIEASDSYTVAIGSYTKATNLYSFASGESTTASGIGSHAEGSSTKATGFDSHAEGQSTTAGGTHSHAEGSLSKAYGIGSHAEGYNTTVQEQADDSHTEGYETKAVGDYVHAEGWGSSAQGDATHAEGYYTVSSGEYTHAEGWGTSTIGKASHAEGYYTEAHSDYQHVAGKYNTPDTNNTYAYIIGGGTGDSARKNIFTVDWSGNVKAAGDVTTGSGVSLNSLNTSLTNIDNIKLKKSGYVTGGYGDVYNSFNNLPKTPGLNVYPLYCNGSSVPDTDAPEHGIAQFYFVIVIYYTGIRGFQMAINIYDNKIFTRKFQDTQWSSWSQL